MKKRFSDEQSIHILREAETGVSARELCRKHAFQTLPSVSMDYHRFASAHFRLRFHEIISDNLKRKIHAMAWI